MSISQSFFRLIDRIQPSPAEFDRANQHLSVIRTCLNSVFELSSCRISGSFKRETSISGFSDIDLFAVFRKINFTWGGSLIGSKRALDHVRKELLARYPNTAIGRDVMAITVAFTDGRVVDVVPALFESFYQKQWPIYLIPDGNDGWMPTCPSLYDSYIEQAHIRSGRKLRCVAQLMKFWRTCRTPCIPLSSFHIEMLLANEDVCKVAKPYSECIRDVFRILTDRECRAIRDPYGIGGYISAAKTAAQCDTAFASVRNSREHANSAVEAETWSVPESRRQWGIVFKNGFPS
jgi:hypothetical protein